MIKDIIIFVAGFVLARYLVLRKYELNIDKVENETLEKVKDKLTSFIDQHFDADNQKVNETVNKIVKF